jgi:hypothetical protein
MRGPLLAAAAALSLVLSSHPISALAQTPEPSQNTSDDALGPGGDHAAKPGDAQKLDQHEKSVEARLQAAQPSGQIDHGRAELQAIRTEQAKLMASHGGLTQTDYHYLAQRVDALDSSLGPAAATPQG